VQQELLPVLEEHCHGMLLHVQQKHCRTIQSFDHPHPDGVEFNNVRQQNPQPASGFIWKTKHDDIVTE
jgi:hypothetical protein